MTHNLLAQRYFLTKEYIVFSLELCFLTCNLLTQRDFPCMHVIGNNDGTKTN